MAVDKKKLLVSLAICFVAEGAGGLFTAQSVGTWYLTLQKPAFTPPGWLFGPVWTLLYLLMGLSLYLIWNARDTHMKKSAIVVFAIQLILNVSWSGAFFGMQSIIGGLIIIVALWLAIILTIYRFRQISRPAAAILLPYLAWVSYASILNYELWRLNL
ncbi:MAG: TspO/MBR family protein [Negativicutes bacterium]